MPGITQRFRISLLGTTYLSFRAAARGMLAEAESRKELFIKYGLSSAVLEGLAAAEQAGVEEPERCRPHGVRARPRRIAF